MLTKAEATNIYDELRAVSWQILEAIGCKREPHYPVIRTKKWKHGIPRGLLYHYTNGPDGLKSMKWGNDPSWGNKGSSWQVTIFDRITSDKVGELWVKLCSKDLRIMFPVPVIIMADFRWSTWHGNWTNDMTMGVENRNCGYSGWTRVDKKNGIEKLGKEPHIEGGRKWEPYTREQMVCNVNLGRMVHAMFSLDPDWIMSHQCIWATKGDTGLAYPIHDVRSAVLSGEPIDQLGWLLNHEMAPDTNVDVDEEFEKEAFKKLEFRGDPGWLEWEEPEPEIEAQHEPEFAAQALYKIGFNAGPELPDEETIKKMVRWFQRSTQAYAAHDKFPDAWALSCDGVCGPKTSAGLQRRLEQLRLTDV